jgi:hypothetical protein
LTSTSVGAQGAFSPEGLSALLLYRRVVEAADLYFVSDSLLDPPGQLATGHAPGVETEHQPVPIAIPGIRSFHSSRSSPLFVSNGKNIGWGSRNL